MHNNYVDSWFEKFYNLSISRCLFKSNCTSESRSRYAFIFQVVRVTQHISNAPDWNRWLILQTYMNPIMISQVSKNNLCITAIPAGDCKRSEVKG